MKEYKPDKSKFKDEKGRYIVQGLFLEDRYNTDLSVYTLTGEDKEYNGVIYPSLKRLYLETEDPVEYIFANKYLYDWPHWERLCNNAILGKHIEQWRKELELSIRSRGVSTMLDLALDDKSYQAAKYLSDKGWVKQPRGRPSKEEIEREKENQARISEQFEVERKLLTLHKGGKK